MTEPLAPPNGNVPIYPDCSGEERRDPKTELREAQNELRYSTEAYESQRDEQVRLFAEASFLAASSRALRNQARRLQVSIADNLRASESARERIQDFERSIEAVEERPGETDESP